MLASGESFKKRMASCQDVSDPPCEARSATTGGSKRPQHQGKPQHTRAINNAPLKRRCEGHYRGSGPRNEANNSGLMNRHGLEGDDHDVISDVATGGYAKSAH